MSLLQKLRDKFSFRSQPLSIQVGLGEELTKKQVVISTREEEAKVEKHYCSSCRYLVDRGGEPTGANPYQQFVLTIHECRHPNNVLIRQWEDYMGTYNYSVCMKTPADLNNHGQCTWWEEKEKTR